MIRVGILGCSDIARRKFIPALLKSEQASLVARASRRQGTTEACAAGVPGECMTYQALVSNPAVDLVYISLPNHLHEKWSIRALEQGKHVICEKPLGLSAGSVIRMLGAAERSDRLLFENLMYLQHPQHMAVKSLIATGQIGRVLSLHSEFTFPGPARGDFRLDPFMGGGAFHDMNRYPLSAALFFLNGVEHRFVRGSREVRNGITWSLQGESKTDAGETFSFLTAFGQEYRSFYEIYGECGSIRVERAYTTPADMENCIIVTIKRHGTLLRVPPNDHFLGTIDLVCELIRRGVWNSVHERSRQLAELADIFHDNCMHTGEPV